MHANNKVGTVQTIEEISRSAHERCIFMHTDAAQPAGKQVLHVDELATIC